MTHELQIHLFGGLTITHQGTTLTAFMSNKAPALLAYLAVTKRIHQRDHLATLLWGEMGDADAKNNLRQVLTNLRKLVDEHLVVNRDTIGFNTHASYFLDVEAFERHLQRAQALPAAQQMLALQAATALYTDEFLAGFFVRDAPAFEEWMLAQKARLRDLALHALHTLTQAQLMHAQYGQVIDSAGRALAIDPWREEAHRQLMIALVRSGQRSAALAQYQSCQRLLQTELGVEPSTETRTLYERIRAAGASIPHNLPPQPTSFVGRVDELATIETRLLQPDCRLLTLLGVGGIGKTRLALQTGERLLQLGTFLNGVYFVSLAGLDAPDLLVTAIAEVCGLAFSAGKDPKVQLIDFLRHQEVLLILDNFEHLLAAGAWLGEILQRAPGVKLLLTSRERLNVRWEWLVEVVGLEATSAAQLFMARAQTVAAHFTVDSASEPAIARICQLTQGLPLGVELAAAAVHYYSCQTIADAIAQNLDLLATQWRDAPPRHRSVRAVFDYSWQLLAAHEQQLFLALSVFQASFSPTAALAVCRAEGSAPYASQAPNVPFTAMLTSLVDKSLVQHSQEGRYQLHTLLRQYAAEKLAQQPDRQATVQRQHGRFYAALLAQQTASIGGSRQQAILSLIEQEIDNVRAAWAWAVSADPGQELLPMIDPLFEFYEVRSLIQEAAERFGQALTALQTCDAARPTIMHTRLKLLNRQARFLSRLGRRREAEILLEQSRAAAQMLGDERELALADNYQGLIKQMDGDYAEAVRLYQAGLQRCRQMDDRVGMARASNNLGVIHLRLGNYADSAHYLQAALALRRQLENPKSIADSLNNLGILQHELGDYARESQLLSEALVYFRQVGDRKGIGTILHNLGGVHLALEQYTEARQFLEEALLLRQADPVGLANTINNLGTAALRAGDFATAATRFAEAIQFALDSHDTSITLDILVGMAEVLLHKGNAAIALELLNFVLTQAQDSDTCAEAERLRALTISAAPSNPSQTTPQTLDPIVVKALSALA